MTTEEDWRDLPDDVEQAFVIFDDRVWAKVVDARKPNTNYATVEQQTPDPKIIEEAERSYVANIRGFVHETCLNIELRENFDSTWNDYFKELRADVVYFKTRFLARARMVFFAKPGETVSLSDDFREEIHHLLNRVRKVVHAADLEQQKKDAIQQKINELKGEVDQSTTRLGRYKAAWLEITEAAGEGAKNLEPAIKMLERVGNIFGKARAETDPAQLPAPETPKQISGPE